MAEGEAETEGDAGVLTATADIDGERVTAARDFAAVVDLRAAAGAGAGTAGAGAGAGAGALCADGPEFSTCGGDVAERFQGYSRSCGATLRSGKDPSFV